MKRLVGALLVVLTCGGAAAKTLLSQAEALRLAFPEAERVDRESHFLTAVQLAQASRLAGSKVETEVWIQYAARKEGRLLGTAYFDTHLVRTLPETLMVVIAPDGTIRQVEVLSFSEPTDYLPRPAWFAQFSGRRLDEELSPSRGIRAVTGATLTTRAATAAVRRVLAVHSLLAPAAAPARPTP